jgi:hypothetical protein
MGLYKAAKYLKPVGQAIISNSLTRIANRFTRPPVVQSQSDQTSNGANNNVYIKVA